MQLISGRAGFLPVTTNVLLSPSLLRQGRALAEVMQTDEGQVIGAVITERSC